MEIHPVRPYTAYDFKRIQKGGRPRHDRPPEGTRVRRVYDFFVENAGEPVAIVPRNVVHFGGILNNLQTFWGLDIRRIQSGSKRTNRMSIYVLSAYWDGHKYVDCIEESMIPLLLKLRESSLRPVRRPYF